MSQSPVPALGISTANLSLLLLRNATNPDENAIVSAVALQTIYAMTLAGTNDEAMKEFSTVIFNDFKDADEVHTTFAQLCPDLAADPNFIFCYANRLYLQDYDFHLRAAFEDKLKDVYKSSVGFVNFRNGIETANLFNSWAAKYTKGKLTAVVSAEQVKAWSNLKFVVFSAAFFKGFWKENFDSSKTVSLPFYIAAEKATQNVDTMCKTANVEYAEDSTFRLVRLRHRGGKLSTCFILPNENVASRDVEQQLTGRALLDLIASAKSKTVSLQVPKFLVEASYQFDKSLIGSSTGEPSVVFKKSANFSRMINIADEDDYLAISRVVHKAAVQFDEGDDDDGAATVESSLQQLVPSDGVVVEFFVNRPFLFAIFDEISSAVIFFGRCADPRSESLGDSKNRGRF